MKDLKRQQWLAVLLVVAISASFCRAQSSPQLAGHVSSLVPHATRQGKQLQQNDSLFAGDTLNTDKSGRLRVKLEDGSLLSLGGKSQMVITQHDAANRQTSLQLAFGRLRSDVAALTQPGAKFEVRTAAAVAGVIGTDFLVVVTPKGTYVYCYSGKVSVTSLATGASVTLNAGEAVLVTDSGIGSPYPFKPGEEVGEGATVGTTGGLSTVQIAGISLGALGGVLGGVVATTDEPGGAALPTPTPTPPPCIIITAPNAAQCINIKGGTPRGLPSAPSASLGTARQFSAASRLSANRPAATVFNNPAFRAPGVRSVTSPAAMQQYRPTSNWLARNFVGTHPVGSSVSKSSVNWMSHVPVLAIHPGLARSPLVTQIARTPLDLQVGRVPLNIQPGRGAGAAQHSSGVVTTWPRGVHGRH